MTIETSLSQYLEDNVALAAKVYPMALPEKPVFPALVYLRITAIPEYSHSGYSSLTPARFQISCWDLTYKGVRQLAAQVKIALEGYSGIMGDVRIGHALEKADRDMGDPVTGRHHAPLDFSITYSEI